MKKLINILLLLLLGISGLRAQTIADSLALHEPGRWETIEQLSDGTVVRTARFDTLCAAPQCLTLCIIPSGVKGTGVGVSDSLISIDSLSRLYSARVAVNGSFFDIKSGGSVCFLKTGSTLRDTTSMSRATANAALRLGSEPVILPWSREAEKQYCDTIGDIIVSGPMLVFDSREEPLNEGVSQRFAGRRHPRTAVGITANGELLLVVADGRHVGDAEGLTLPQLSWLMRQLGAVSAINLDGGGSSVLWTRVNGVVSHPSDNFEFDHLGDRAIPNIIYLR